MPSARLILAAAVVVVVTLPAVALAQGTLVTNLGVGFTGGDPLDQAGLASAHAFTTGPMDVNFHSVSIRLGVVSDSSFRVKLWSGAGSSPVSVLEDLGTVNVGTSPYTDQTVLSSTRPTLQKNTRYWISVENLSGEFDWKVTDSDWNIGGVGSFDDLSRRSTGGGSTWPNAGAAGEYHQFAVFALLPSLRDASFTPPASLKGSVCSIALQPDGRILVGGHIRVVEGLSALGRLESDGSHDPTFTPPANLSGAVFCIAVYADGRILVGGDFTDVGGVGTLDRLVRLNADGSRDPSFTPPANLNATVHCAILQADGRILIGGGFTDVGGVTTLDRLARLNADGSRDTSFIPPADLNGSVRCIVPQPDGRILVGGGFTDAAGMGHLDFLVRLNEDGAHDPSFSRGVRLNSSLNGLALQPDGKILVGGAFVDVEGVDSLDRLIRLNADGSRDPSFTPPAHLNESVASILQQADGKILIGGAFTDVGGQGFLDFVARLNEDGSRDTTFSPFLHGADPVLSLALQTDGKILFGEGSPVYADGSPLVRVYNARASRSLDVRHGALTWMHGGASPEPRRVTFEFSSDGGATYGPPFEASRVSGGWRSTGIRLPLAGTLRARAYVPSGLQNGSTGLVEEVITYLLPRAPELTVLGEREITTSRGRITLLGTARDPDGDLTSVRYKDSVGKWRSAKGTTRWTAEAKLKPGRNTILIAAYDSRKVASAMNRVKVTRR